MRKEPHSSTLMYLYGLLLNDAAHTFIMACYVHANIEELQYQPTALYCVIEKEKL